MIATKFVCFEDKDFSKCLNNFLFPKTNINKKILVNFYCVTKQ